MRASEASKLSTYTGHGGNIVCKHDIDSIDHGLRPYKPRIEQNVPWIRPGDTNTDNAAPLVDLESMSYQWLLASSQDNAILMASQDDAWLIANTPI